MPADSSTWEGQFRASLPDSYGRRHADEDVARHAEISASRNGAPVRVGLVHAPDNLIGLCIVAADAPGLFSNIAAAIRLQGYDITHAEAYTRRTVDGGLEVLDLFQIQLRPGQPSRTASESDVAGSIGTTLLDLLSGRLDPEQALADLELPGDGYRDTRVRFIEDEDGSLSTLEVETDDRSGLLLTLTRALSTLQVSIVRSEVDTRSGRVCDRFTLAEADGTPIGESRRLELQVSVLGAIETPGVWPSSRG